jgi:DNA invertase Pin-like site-specific DNA recombinase
VAAYCRVSTDDEDQVISMELQKKNYRELITGTPNWIYYGTFVDDGYSGTNTEHRRAFQLMMKHAEEGRFEISRGKLIQTHFREHGSKPLEIRHFAVVA